MPARHKQTSPAETDTVMAVAGLFIQGIRDRSGPLAESIAAAIGMVTTGLGPPAKGLTDRDQAAPLRRYANCLQCLHGQACMIFSADDPSVSVVLENTAPQAAISRKARLAAD